jgi:hypothetical protein
MQRRVGMAAMEGLPIAGNNAPLSPYWSYWREIRKRYHVPNAEDERDLMIRQS